MSSINGDKARFHRIKKNNAVRRERMRDLRKKLNADAAAIAALAPPVVAAKVVTL